MYVKFELGKDWGKIDLWIESHTNRGILSLGEESEGIGAEARCLWMRVAFVKLVKRALTRCFAQIDPIFCSKR
jgi:hypothetical protein